MDYLLVALVSGCLSAAVAHVVTDRLAIRRLMALEPIETDPELRLVDIAERKQELYRSIGALDAEEGFILETWAFGTRPAPRYLSYEIEKPAW